MGKLADPKDLETVSELEQMTNERVREERGQAAWIAPQDRVSGPGSEHIMAPFTYRNPGGSRFSDGGHGVYYAAHALPTAIEETKHHRRVFMSRTKEGPMRLELHALTAELNADLHDIRGRQKQLTRVYSPTSYSASQALAGDLVKTSANGIVYDSVRHVGGQCAAVFKPSALSDCRPERQLIFEWDGAKIDKVYELNEYSG